MQQLTHKGWLLACPVYIGEPDAAEPVLEPRRFVPEWWMDVNNIAFGVFAIIATALVPTFEPRYPILITGSRPPADTWEPAILDFIHGRSRVTMTQILDEALHLKRPQWDRGAQVRVSAILRRHGWARWREATGARQWYWARAIDPQLNSSSKECP